jgi:hypothetical protein
MLHDGFIVINALRLGLAVCKSQPAPVAIRDDETPSLEEHI